MKDIKVLGIDLAKNVFQLHGTNAKGFTQIYRKDTMLSVTHKSWSWRKYGVVE